MRLLQDLHDRGHTVILITHDEAVASHAHRIIRLSDGKITSDAPSKPSGDKRSTKKAAPTLNQNIKEKTQHIDSANYSAATMTAETGETVVTALRSLRANLFRTMLTLLGIVIGVAAVITMMAVGNGSKQSVLDRISAMGTNILSVRPGAPGIRSTGSIATMTIADAEAIEALDNIEVVVPERNGNKTVRYGSTDYATSIQAVGAGLPIARDWAVAEGQFFTLPDLDSYAPVAVLGSTVAKLLFPDGADAVGEYILIGNIPFEVIGIMSEKGAAPWGRDQDDTVFVPVTTGLVRLFGRSFLNSITVKVIGTDTIDATEAAITELLIDRHKVEDFSVRNTASFLEMAAETQNTLTILLGAVAAISLLVGGIGVMNIMLVSVTERTREIGVRMAIGARRRDILFQFNTEAAIVCTIGGAIGIATGVGAGMIIALFGVNILFSTGPAVLAFICAVATGLVFGYLPARKAAHLDPVVALSTE